MVRIYRPGLDPSNNLDFKRHRFYTSDDIERIGSQDVRDILIESVGRRSRNQDLDLFTSIEDLRSRKREIRLEELRKYPLEKKERKELEEEIELIKMELDDKEKERDNLEILLGKQDEEISELEKQIHEYKSKVKQLEYEKRKISSEPKGNLKTDIPPELRALPSTLEESVIKIEKLFPNRIEITERALRSAKDHDFKDIDKAWKCLWDMCTILYDSYFEVEGKNVSKYFEDRSQFDVATSPSSSTRDDKEKMKDRLMEYKPEDGDKEIIDISPHLKAQSGDSFLRIHYHAHEKHNKLIVGHCGKHLDTAGTHRRS